MSSYFRGSAPTDRATWLAMLAYCHAEENGGTIKGAASWGDRKWQQVVAVTKEETRSECDLWSWEGEDLVVHHFPIRKQAEVVAKREAGRNGGKAKSEGKAKAAAENGKSGGRPKTQAEPKQKPNGTEQNGTEQNGTEGKPQAGDAITKVLQRFCTITKRHFSFESVKDAIRFFDVGTTTEEEMSSKISAICDGLEANPSQIRFAPSLDKLVAGHGWMSPVEAFTEDRQKAAPAKPAAKREIWQIQKDIAALSEQVRDVTTNEASYRYEYIHPDPEIPEYTERKKVMRDEAKARLAHLKQQISVMKQSLQ